MNAALLLTALFNGAWQGTALCLLALQAFRLFRRLNATTMFAVWSVSLAIVVLLPAANYALAVRPYVVRVVAQASAPRYLGGASIPYHDTGARASIQRNAGVTLRYRSAAEASRPLPSTRNNSLNIVDLVTTVFRYAPAILALLALIALLRLGWLGRDVVRMLVARKRVRTIEPPVAVSGDIARPYRYAASNEFTSPCVLGFAPALIVIPEDLLADDRAELTSVVLHEREHVRRFDDVQNVVHRIIGALGFFCPGVRIALRELALYREQICDDAAVNATGDRISYAMTLTDLAQWAQGRGAPVPSLIFKRKHLLHRLEVLLDSAVSHSLRMNRRFALAAAAAVVLAAVLVLRIQVPVVAQTLVTPAPPPQAVRAQVRAEAAKVRAQTAQVRAEAAQTRAHLSVVRAMVKQMRAQAVTVRAQTQVRTQEQQMRKQMLQVRQQVEQARKQEQQAHEQLQRVHERLQHVHEHAHLRARLAQPLASAPTIAIAPPVTVAANSMPGNLLDALSSAGLRNLSVDDLVALRDHGVTPELVHSASSYFGHVKAEDLVYLADHGVGPQYISTLTASGVRGISPKEATTLMDHGVSASLISAASAYFGHVGAGDLTLLADHGVMATVVQGYQAAGLSGVSVHDMIRLFDNGVDGRYVAKVRRFNSRATVDDIIRLRDAGF